MTGNLHNRDFYAKNFAAVGWEAEKVASGASFRLREFEGRSIAEIQAFFEAKS